MANEGPSLTKATYDKKPARRPAPSPARQKAAQEEKVRDAAKQKQLAQRATKVGWAAALFPEKFPPEEPIKRRI